MSEPRAPRKARRLWFSLSLRGAMVAVIVIGVPLGWLARRVSIQKRAVRTIEAMGGEVTYDYQRPNPDTFSPNAEPSGPRWLRRMIGDDYFRDVTWAVIGHAPFFPREPVAGWLNPVLDLDHLEWLESEWPIDDEGLARLASSRGICRLRLGSAAIGDAGLVALGTMGRLESLQITVPPGSRGRITGAGLAHLEKLDRLRILRIGGVDLNDPADLRPIGRLARLQNLEIQDSPRDEACLKFLSGLGSLIELDLRRTAITDAGLAVVAVTSRFLHLTFDGSRVTDAGLAHLTNQTNLMTLHLGRLPLVTDAGLAHLCQLTRLGNLNLSGSAITDAGLVHLGQKGWLGGLVLADTGITDAGLAPIVAMGQLNELDLSGTRITDAGLAQLAAMNHIFTLKLARTAITDAGLAHLIAKNPVSSPGPVRSPLIARPRRLLYDYIDLRGTRVTPAGLAALRSAFPHLEINADGLPPAHDPNREDRQ